MIDYSTLVVAYLPNNDQVWKVIGDLGLRARVVFDGVDVYVIDVCTEEEYEAGESALLLTDRLNMIPDVIEIVKEIKPEMVVLNPETLILKSIEEYVKDAYKVRKGFKPLIRPNETKIRRTNEEIE